MLSFWTDLRREQIRFYRRSSTWLMISLFLLVMGITHYFAYYICGGWLNNGDYALLQFKVAPVLLHLFAIATACHAYEKSNSYITLFLFGIFLFLLYAIGLQILTQAFSILGQPDFLSNLQDSSFYVYHTYLSHFIRFIFFMTFSFVLSHITKMRFITFFVSVFFYIFSYLEPQYLEFSKFGFQKSLLTSYFACLISVFWITQLLRR